MIKLHCFGESGNAYKAALTLELSEAEWEPVYVDFFNGATRGEDFRAMNVMGEVPVMEDGDLILTQSGVIQDYVSSKTTKSAALPEYCGSIPTSCPKKSETLT
jgi:glutathione S-transferase